VAVPVLPLLGRLAGLPESRGRFGQRTQRAFKTSGENPALPVAVALVEPGNVISKAETSHLGTNSLEDTVAQVVLVCNRFENWQELAFSPLDLNKDSEEEALMVALSGEENTSKFLQVLESGNPIVIQIDFRGDQTNSPP